MHSFRVRISGAGRETSARLAPVRYRGYAIQNRLERQIGGRARTRSANLKIREDSDRISKCTKTRRKFWKRVILRRPRKKEAYEWCLNREANERRPGRADNDAMARNNEKTTPKRRRRRATRTSATHGRQSAANWVSLENRNDDDASQPISQPASQPVAEEARRWWFANLVTPRNLQPAFTCDSSSSSRAIRHRWWSPGTLWQKQFAIYLTELFQVVYALT